MRLQFLGDDRDAFKWDCLHSMVSESPMLDHLLVVPMRREDEGSKEGKIRRDKSRYRKEIQSFLEELEMEPRSFDRIRKLGQILPTSRFSVEVYKADRNLGSGWERSDYWTDLLRSSPSRTLVFLDPDNGFEPENSSNDKHLRFGEAQTLLDSLGESSVLAVYQHRPQGLSWNSQLEWLWRGLPDEIVGQALCPGEAGLVFLARPDVLEQLGPTIQGYRQRHPHLNQGSSLLSRLAESCGNRTLRRED